MPEKLNDQELDRQVLHLITQHVGKANAIDRWVMVEKLFGAEAVEPQSDDNIWDREIRYSVNRLRLAGWHICDLGDGHGRYIAQNEAEFWEWYGSYAKPLKSRADILRAVKKSAMERWPNLLQPSLFNLDEEITV